MGNIPKVKQQEEIAALLYGLQLFGDALYQQIMSVTGNTRENYRVVASYAASSSDRSPKKTPCLCRIYAKKYGNLNVVDNAPRDSG